jgi:hypothetical protein
MSLIRRNSDSTSKNTSGSILAGLKFTAATKPTKQSEQQRSPRNVVLEFLKDQTELAKADIAGGEYTVSRTRFSKDDAGKSIKKVVNVAPRRAYWQHGSEWLGALKYGNVIVELSPGNPSFVAGAKLEDVVKTFELISKAVEAGECDAQIAAAAGKAKRHKNEAKAA